MKVAFLHHSFILGSGIDSVIYQLAKRMARAHNISIFTFNSDYSADFGVEIREMSIPFKKNRLVSGVLSPLFVHRWHQIRKSIESYDVVISQLYPANLIPVLPSKVRGPLNIVIEWSGDLAPSSKFSDRAYFRLTKKTNGLACKRADIVIVSSHFVREQVEKEYNVKAINILLDGVDFNLFDKDRVPPVSIYESHPSLRKSLSILYVGRIFPRKNIETLIRSLAIIKKKIPEVTLVLVGAKTFPDYYRHLLQLTSELNLQNSVIFTGIVSWEDLPKYYAACDVYATCSLWEGFLRAEAYALQKPMVAFDVASHSETIEHGRTGLLVTEMTPEAFASALVSLLSDEKLRKEMGENGYKWAKENLNFDVIAEEFEKFIEDSLSARACT